MLFPYRPVYRILDFDPAAMNEVLIRMVCDLQGNLRVHKTIDKAPHQKLSCKIKSYGVRYNIFVYIVHLLAFRKQQGSLNVVISEWQDVIDGVPQGSVLAHQQFISMGSMKEAKVCLLKFADNTKMCNNVNYEDDTR